MTVTVYGSGLISGATVNAGGTAIFSSGATGHATRVNSGGTAIVQRSAIDSGAFISSGGVELVFNGIGSAVTIAGGQLVVSGISGRVNSDIVTYGGELAVSAGGYAIADTIRSGGKEAALSAGTSLSAGVSSGGELAISAAGEAVDAVVSNGGLMVVSSGGAAGLVTLKGGTEIVLSGGVASVNVGYSFGADISFASGTSGTLAIASPSASAVIYGFTSGDQLDIYGVPYASGAAATLASGNVLSVSENGQVYTFDLDPSANYSGQTFSVTSTVVSAPAAGLAASSTEITLACFRAGTLIATQGGAVPVEALREGDLVLAHDGEGGTGFSPRPVVWLGQRDVNCASHPKPRNVWPVRIRAGAFGAGKPLRDLFLSPDHAVFVDGVLIPVKLLCNGGSIAQIETARLTYYHIELPAHAVVLAEGLAVESYLDAGDRANFANGGAPMALFPDFTARLWEVAGCAPLILTGAKLAEARASIAGVAADTAERQATG